VTDEILEDGKKSLAKLRTDATRIEDRLASSIDVDGVRAKIEELEAEVSREGKLRDSVAAKRKSIDELKAAIIDATEEVGIKQEEYRERARKREELRVRKKEIETARAGVVSCPNCSHEFDPSGDEVYREEDVALVAKTIEEVEAELEKISGYVDSAEKAKDALAFDLRNAETAEDRDNLELRGIPEKKRRLGRLREDLGGTGTEAPPTEEDLVEIRGRIANADQVVRAIETYRDDLRICDANRKKKTRLETERSRYEAIEKLCRPDGLPTKLLAPAVGPIRDRLAEISPILFDPDETIHRIDLSDDFEPVVFDRSGERHGLETLNESVRWRVGFLFADALAQLSGLRFLALDETTLLDVANRATLFSALLEIADDYDQVLLAAVVGDVEPTQFPDDLDARLYVAEDGAVRLAPEASGG
jgi:DNA repair exonuclease SbcCD ATPase subunit